MERNKGIIILGGHVQALGITRILGRLGYPIIILDNTNQNLARHSKYCTKFIKIHDTEILSHLKGIGKNQKYQNYVILPTNDFHVELLSSNKKKLSEYFKIGTDEWSSVGIFYNKIRTYELAKLNDIPIAKTYYPTSIHNLDLLDIEFPCIIKPAIMHSFHQQTKKKVFVCDDLSTLKLNYQLALNFIPKEEIIVQEIIQGPSKNQFSACFLFLNGKSYVSLTACRMRQHPLDFGNATTYAESIDLPELKAYGEKILCAANYNGLCEVEFKLDERDHKYKFLEVNTRTWKWHSIANKTETPFLKQYVAHLYGVDIKPIEGFKKASFFHLITDYPMRLKLFLKGYKYWNRKIEPVEYAVYAKDDVKPWLMEKIYLPYLITKR